MLLLLLSLLLCLAIGIIIVSLWRVHYGLLSLLVVGFATGSFSAYWYLGDSQGLSELRQLQEQRQLAEAFVAEHGDDPAVIAAQLKQRVQEDPESAQGWYLLGRLYMVQMDYAAAVDAFATAYQLQSTDLSTLFQYAQALYFLSDHQLTPLAEELLTDILAYEPDYPDALGLLAAAAYQAGDYQVAIDYWQAILRLNPPTALRDVLLEAIAKAEGEL